MSYTLEVAKDLAVELGAGSDDDASQLRGRVVIIVWAPGLALCAAAGAASGSIVLGLSCLVLFVAGLWLFAFRPGATSRFVRKVLRRA